MRCGMCNARHPSTLLLPIYRRGEQSMVKVALLVRLEAKPGKEAAVEKFLEGALPLANAESTTPVWFALRLGPSTFGIFDAFRDDAGRKAHLAGPIAAALMANATELLAQPPQIEQVDLLAVKLPTKGEIRTPAARENRRSGLTSRRYRSILTTGTASVAGPLLARERHRASARARPDVASVLGLHTAGGL